MTAYAFRYKGDILPDQSRESVQRNLAQLFHAPPDNLDCIFKAEAIFEVIDLDEDTAEAYARTFRAAGALGQISAINDECESNEANGPLPATPFDPNQTAQHYTQNTRPEEASDRSTSGTIYTPLAANPPSVLAIRWLQCSVIAILIIIGLDKELTGLQLGRSYDMGLGPLLLAHVSLLIGCFLFARDRELNPIVGLLGIFSLVGLSVLIMVSAREHHEKVTVKQISMLAFSLFMVFYWYQDWRPPTKFIEKHAAKTESLPAGRHEYPFRTLDQANTTYLLEQKEMQAYLEWSLTALTNQNMRPDTITLLADDTFRALARYQAWRNFQHFLHLSKGKKLPYSLSDEGAKHHHKSFHAILSRLNVSGPPRLREAKLKWIDMYSETPSPVRHFSKTLEGLLTQFQVKSMDAHNKTHNVPLEALNRFNMSPLVTSFGNGVSATAEGNIVAFTFDKPKLRDKPLHVAFYWDRFNRNKKWVYRRNLRIVSGTFPLEHLHSMFHVLRVYSNAQ